MPVSRAPSVGSPRQIEDVDSSAGSVTSTVLQPPGGPAAARPIRTTSFAQFQLNLTSLTSRGERLKPPRTQTKVETSIWDLASTRAKSDPNAEVQQQSGLRNLRARVNQDAKVSAR